MNNPFSLEGKTILVTGASSGIGRSVAIECSKMGACMVITGRNKERLDETFGQLQGDGHISIVADMTHYEDVVRVVDSVPALDGVSHNAGITKVVMVKHLQFSDLNDIMNTNTLSPILLTQLLVKNRKINKNSSIVFTSSLSGNYCVHYGESMYAASKGAISGFAKGAALDLSRSRIRVNCVCPGIVRTNIFSGVLTEEELEAKQQYFPLKRFGEPTDVAYAIIYFLSDAACWITGAELKIDGGYTLI